MSLPVLNVLLVEDEILIRMDLADTLKNMGHCVVEAQNADDALRLFGGTMRIDLLLTDVDMPGSVNGLTLASVVKDSRPRCHILFLSGGRRPEQAEMPSDSRFLAKPTTGKALTDAIVGLTAA
jgi:CheY-like chemotaxis protein